MPMINNEIIPIRKDENGNLNIDYYATKSNIVIMSDNGDETLDDRMSDIKSNSNLVQCDTAEDDLAKVVDFDKFSLSNNKVIYVKFTNKVNQSSTLNVNNTGAKPIYYRNSPITEGIILAGNIAGFIYDGNNYNLITIDSVNNATGGGGISATVEGTTLIL